MEQFHVINNQKNSTAYSALCCCCYQCPLSILHLKLLTQRRSNQLTLSNIIRRSCSFFCWYWLTCDIRSKKLWQWWGYYSECKSHACESLLKARGQQRVKVHETPCIRRQGQHFQTTTNTGRKARFSSLHLLPRHPPTHSTAPPPPPPPCLTQRLIVMTVGFEDIMWLTLLLLLYL